MMHALSRRSPGVETPGYCRWPRWGQTVDPEGVTDNSQGFQPLVFKTRTHAMISRCSRSFALAALAVGLVFTGGLTPRRSPAFAEDKKPDAPKFTAAQVTFYEKEV